MDTTVKSTAGIRQFEQTAVAKLVAEGVPKHIADAFVLHGLPKTGRTQQLKDIVCKMKYEKFFIERTDEDFKNPLRVGGLFPNVVESKAQKFHTEFAMSDIDAAKFTKAFPEFDVVARGKTYNQHAFYANKRYAETELLVTHVYMDSAISGLNPRSLIDFGGNDAWHIKRKRDYVHCDNPVLSARDVMRYKVREVFSGSNRADICPKAFAQCDYKADYAIAVHSTYDVSPKEIARSMMKKGVKKFYGVINYIPGVEMKPEGTYEADGVTMTIVRPTRGAAYAKCGFRHDPSLEYRHRLSVLRKYLFVSKRYDFVEGKDDKGKDKFCTYTYTVQSVRGNSLVFCISQGALMYGGSDAVWSPPTKSLYYLSLKFLGVHRMEVDAEYFDRLVFQAASVRNEQQYDIVSLFRYAKSLRQKVSINNVVLSSGFGLTPEELVYSVIAAYATAGAYRIEGSSYFKKASSQIMQLRGKGFFRDVFDITAKAIRNALVALPIALAGRSGMTTILSRIQTLVAAQGTIQVEVYKPHANQGTVYDPLVLNPYRPPKLPYNLKNKPRESKALQQKGVIGELTVRTESKIYPHPVQDTYLPTYVECDGHPTCFYSKGLLAYDPRELPRSSKAPRLHEFDKTKYSTKGVPVAAIRDELYSEALERIAGLAKFDSQSLVMSNGDRIYRRGVSSALGLREEGRDDVPLLNDQMQYFVFRGVGDKAVTLSPPAMYERGVCLGFVLFYGRRSNYKKHEEEVQDAGGSSVTATELPESAVPFEERIYDNEEWENLKSDAVSFDGVHSIEVRDDGRSSNGDHQPAYMSGALPSSLPLTPVSQRSEPQFISDYVSPFVPSDDANDGASVHSNITTVANTGTVLSDDVVPGRSAVEELVGLCSRSEEVAIASSRAVIDLATSAAKGDATVSRFQSTAQGHPGDIRMVQVKGDEFIDYATNEKLDHMAVSDGVKVYDRITSFPPEGIYVTSNEMMIYTGAAIRQAVESTLHESYSCAVTCVNGVAGSGKSYHIEHNAAAGDVILCETRESLKDISSAMHKVPGWRGHAYTVDAFLMRVPVREANTLWIDEAFRLHAGKIYAVMKILKPKKVFCFGDDKQIPVLPFVPQFEFVYHQFPFTSYERRAVSWRCPADVCFALSQAGFYGFTMQTHNPILRSMLQPKQFVAGMFDLKHKNIPLLVYTQTCKDDLKKQGISSVMTVGESQGKTFDEVILFRDNTLDKDIYLSRFQTLVALTRHKKKFTYVTANNVMGDRSGIASLYNYVYGKSTELILASHVVAGVKPAQDAATLEAREVRPASLLSRQESSTTLDVQTVNIDDWADFMDDVEES